VLPGPADDDHRYRFLWRVEKRWHEYGRAQKPTYRDPPVRWLEKRLIEDAGTAPPELSIVNRGGFGSIEESTVDVLDNWLRKTEKIVPLVNVALIRAQGHYKDERDKSLNPLGWIESLVFLPKNIIGSIDPRVPKWVKDMVQIAYWIIVSAVAVYKVTREANP
jgi:hypothetical protein